MLKTQVRFQLYDSQGVNATDFHTNLFGTSKGKNIYNFGSYFEFEVIANISINTVNLTTVNWILF